MKEKLSNREKKLKKEQGKADKLAELEREREEALRLDEQKRKREEKERRKREAEEKRAAFMEAAEKEDGSSCPALPRFPRILLTSATLTHRSCDCRQHAKEGGHCHA